MHVCIRLPVKPTRFENGDPFAARCTSGAPKPCACASPGLAAREGLPSVEPNPGLVSKGELKRHGWCIRQYWAAMPDWALAHEEMRDAQRRSAALRAEARHYEGLVRQREDAVSGRMHQYRRAMGILSDGIRDAEVRRRDCLARSEVRAQEARQHRRVVRFHLRRFATLRRLGLRRLRLAETRFRQRSCAMGRGKGIGAERIKEDVHTRAGGGPHCDAGLSMGVGRGGLRV